MNKSRICLKSLKIERSNSKTCEANFLFLWLDIYVNRLKNTHTLFTNVNRQR